MPEMIDVREFAENWADQAESFHQKKGSKFSTPEGILKHPDLLEGGWGWNRLMPCFGNLDWSVYKNYLEQYYLRNCAESVAQEWQNEQVSGLTPLGSLSKNGSVAEACRDKQEAYANSIGDGSVLASLASLSQNVNGSATQAWRHEQEAYAAVNAIQSGLAPLVSLCVKMEKQFISECKKWGFGDNAADHIILSEDIQERALSLKNMGDKFPVAAAALMFITKKAELMCEWLRRGAFTPESMVTAVRRCALNLMMYRGSEYACAAALMVGIAKETKTLCDCLRQDDPAVNLSVTIMKNGWESLEMLHDEFLPAGNDDGHAATEAVNSAQSDTNVELDDESDDEEVIIRKMLVHWENEANSYLDFSYSIPPHPAIFNRLDLLTTGWGWERLVPFYDAPRPHWSMYKNYLKEYCRHNSAESTSQAWEIVVPAGNGIRDGDGLTPLASLCVKMEEQFISLCEEHGFGGDDADHIILSKEIKKRTLSLKDMGNEFPVAAAALLLLTKKAELMCEWLRRGTCTRGSMITTAGRCALNLMMYTGSEYDCAAALMVGIAKEIKRLCEGYRQDDPAVYLSLSVTIIKNGWESLEMLHDEFLPAGNGDGHDTTEAGNSAQIDTSGKLDHKRQDDKKDSDLGSRVSSEKPVNRREKKCRLRRTIKEKGSAPGRHCIAIALALAHRRDMHST